MWKTIDFEPNYEVSSFGEVRNKFTKVVKKLRYDRGGYLRVTLYPSGKTYLIHRLVARVFIENPKQLPAVNHKDGVKTNNSLDNLEWCTNRDNLLHAYNLGLNKHQDISGEKNPSAKLTRKEVEHIRVLKETGLSITELAVMFGVKPTCISRIVKYITWK